MNNSVNIDDIDIATNKNDGFTIYSLDLILLLLTGLIWGSSNFFIQIIPYFNFKNRYSGIFFNYLYYILLNVPFFIVYIYDKLGSVTFYFSLGRKTLSVSDVVLYSNGFSIILGFIFEYSYFKIQQRKTVNLEKTINIDNNSNLTIMSENKPETYSTSYINSKLNELEDKNLIIAIILILIGAYFVK